MPPSVFGHKAQRRAGAGPFSPSGESPSYCGRLPPLREASPELTWLPGDAVVRAETGNQVEVSAPSGAWPAMYSAMIVMSC